ncbi:MAG: YitT family protein [Actinomycetota bacterium]
MAVHEITQGLRQWLRLSIGLIVFALGISLMVRAHLGLSPWDVLHQAINGHTPLTFGQVVIIVSVAAVALGWLLGVRPGPGTVANSILVGLVADLLLSWKLLGNLVQASMPARLTSMVIGVAAIAFGTAIYVGAELGAGPRDGLMVGVARLAASSPGVARVAIEATVLIVGLLLGGTVGIGTIVFVLTIGPAINASFRIFGMEPPKRHRSGTSSGRKHL